MIEGQTVMAVVTARGGSKGLVGKNIRPLAGKPLLVWTIEQARAAKTVDRVVLSSDDPEIIRIGEAAGCEVPFVRPAELATDEATTVDVLRHLVRNTDPCGYVVLLQPTSPFRTHADIDGAVRLCRERKASSCVSMTLADKSPQWMYFMQDDLTLAPCMPVAGFRSRRQDMPPVYSLNGAVYVIERERLIASGELISDDTIGYAMPAERSIDIDNELDFEFAEFVAKKTLESSL